MFTKPNSQPTVRQIIAGTGDTRTWYALSDTTSSTPPTLTALKTNTWSNGYSSVLNLSGATYSAVLWLAGQSAAPRFARAQTEPFTHTWEESNLLPNFSISSSGSISGQATDSAGNMVAVLTLVSTVHAFYWPAGSSNVIKLTLPTEATTWSYDRVLYWTGTEFILHSPANGHVRISSAGDVSDVMITTPPSKLVSTVTFKHPTIARIITGTQSGTATDASDGWSSTYWALTTNSTFVDGGSFSVTHRSYPNPSERTTQPLWKSMGFGNNFWLDGYWYLFGSINGGACTCYRTKVDISVTPTTKADWQHVPALSLQSLYNTGFTVIS